ncbi:hypothetical protein [Piscirickettsia salmonis]|uniref:hypothetical protein n=1 Tax=Piscirickettsia salmonis TaxID=1238 RepID=UPI0009B84773|nr:hypothetical protein [Piscirickettsia salmonis]
MMQNRRAKRDDYKPSAVFRNSALLKTRTYLGLLTPCLALHGSQRQHLGTKNTLKLLPKPFSN